MYRLASKDGKVVMQDIKAVIFDCDGVLVNTEYLKFLAWQRTLASEKYGKTSFTIQEYMPLIGGASTAILAEIIKLKPELAKLDVTNLITEKNDLYAKIQTEGVPPIADGVEFLKDMFAKRQQYGLKIGLASSAKHSQIEENLKQIGIAESDFDAIVSGSSDLAKGTNKPNPAIYNLIAQKLQVNPSECLVIEDSGDGVVAGADAGMVVIAAPNEYTKDHDLSRAALKTNLGLVTFERIDQDVNLSTDEILQQPPFNLTKQEDREDFLKFTKEIGMTTDDFLLGKVYKKKPYSYAQQQEIAQDLVNIYQMVFSGKSPSENPVYIATAGAPGVGKSGFAVHNIGADSKVYIDPDRQALCFMQGYQAMVTDDSKDVRKAAYEIYRDGSNYIANMLMLWALYKRYSIVHGTTGTNPRMATSILPTIKKLGYEIDIHVLFADVKSREGSLKNRTEVQNFYQVTNIDAKGKVAPVFTRLFDAFLAYGDKVDLYYNTGSYWENTTKEQSDICLKHFASFERAKDPEHVLINSDNRYILDKLVQDVTEEVKPENQEDVFKMFDKWFKISEPEILNRLKMKQ